MKIDKKILKEFSIFLFVNICIDQDDWEMTYNKNDDIISLDDPESFDVVIDDFIKNKDIE